jgi:hypothetical protein
MHMNPDTAAGVLRPGEVQVCQVAFEAGLAPQLFAGEVFCEALSLADDAAAAPGCRAAGGLTLQQWRALRGAGSAGRSGEHAEGACAAQQRVEGQEEVLAQHPER